MHFQNVAIPHPSEQLRLSKITREVIFTLNETVSVIVPRLVSEFGCYVLPSYPLWCFGHFDTGTLTVFSPAADDSGVYFPCSHGRIPAAAYNKAILEKIEGGQQNDVMNAIKAKLECFKSFTLCCRIFQAGKMAQEKNGWKVFDTKWVKVPLSTLHDEHLSYSCTK